MSRRERAQAWAAARPRRWLPLMPAIWLGRWLAPGLAAGAKLWPVLVVSRRPRRWLPLGLGLVVILACPPAPTEPPARGGGTPAASSARAAGPAAVAAASVSPETGAAP